MIKIVKHTSPITFAAYAHEIGPLKLLAELLANGTKPHHAVMVVDELFGDRPEFCPHCNQIIEED